MPWLSDYDLWKTTPPWFYDEDPPEDPFMDWADDEAERQFDMHASHDVEPELACVPSCFPAEIGDQK